MVHHETKIQQRPKTVKEFYIRPEQVGFLKRECFFFKKKKKFCNFLASINDLFYNRFLRFASRFLYILHNIPTISESEENLYGRLSCRCLVLIESITVRISGVKRSEQREHSVLVVHHTVLFVQRPTGAVELSYSAIRRAKPTSVTFMGDLEVMCPFDLPPHHEENHLNKQAAE